MFWIGPGCLSSKRGDFIYGDEIPDNLLEKKAIVSLKKKGLVADEMPSSKVAVGRTVDKLAEARNTELNAELTAAKGEIDELAGKLSDSESQSMDLANKLDASEKTVKEMARKLKAAESNVAQLTKQITAPKSKP